MFVFKWKPSLSGGKPGYYKKYYSRSKVVRTKEEATKFATRKEAEEATSCLMSDGRIVKA